MSVDWMAYAGAGDIESAYRRQFGRMEIHCKLEEPDSDPSPATHFSRCLVAASITS